MMSLRSRWVVPVLSVLAIAAPAAAEHGARSFLEQRHDAVRTILKRPAKTQAERSERGAQLAHALGALLDYEELSRRALRDHWDSLADGERREFVSLLSQLVEHNYQRNLESTLDFSVRYLEEVAGPAGIVVQTVARSRKNGRVPEIAIDYTLVARDGAFRVYDVTTDGVSLVTNYRSQFNRIIRKEGWDALLERMRKRLHGGDGLL